MNNNGGIIGNNNSGFSGVWTMQSVYTRLRGSTWLSTQYPGLKSKLVSYIVAQEPSLNFVSRFGLHRTYQLPSQIITSRVSSHRVYQEDSREFLSRLSLHRVFKA
jgi:hypothetical protein